MIAELKEQVAKAACFFGSIIFRVDGNFPPTLF